jgi:hypothetical protein
MLEGGSVPDAVGDIVRWQPLGRKLLTMLNSVAKWSLQRVPMLHNADSQDRCSL